MHILRKTLRLAYYNKRNYISTPHLATQIDNCYGGFLHMPTCINERSSK
jgi:hypothetical protein